MRTVAFRTSASLVGLALVAVGAAQSGLALQTVATGLTQPLAYVPDPSHPGTGYSVQQNGVVRTITPGGLGSNLLTLPGTAFQDSGERGLLGLALAPDWATSGKAYAYFTRPDGNNQVAEFTRAANGTLDYATRRDIVSFTKVRANHNGGTLAFGPDGFLYIGTGDSGGSYDPDGVSQDLSSNLGKILRINPTGDDFAGDPTKNYAIPSNNPFRTRTGADPAIWALGVRNPFKWSFDSLTGSLVIADVGQDTREEVDYLPSGGGTGAGPGGRNLGWLPFEGNLATGRGTVAPGTTVYGPIFDIDHSTGAHSITGGALVRGGALGAENDGRYFYGDYVGGTFSSIRVTVGANGEATAGDLINYTNLGSFGNISSIDRDLDGTVLITDYNGRLLRLVPEPATLAVLGLGAVALLRRRRVAR